MSQSTVITAAILGAFIVWVTLNGSLGVYLSALGLSGKAPAQNAAASGNVMSGAGAAGFGALGGVPIVGGIVQGVTGLFGG